MRGCGSGGAVLLGRWAGCLIVNRLSHDWLLPGSGPSRIITGCSFEVTGLFCAVLDSSFV